MTATETWYKWAWRRILAFVLLAGVVDVPEMVTVIVSVATVVTMATTEVLDAFDAAADKGKDRETMVKPT